MDNTGKFTILIVDDNAHNLQVLAEVVEESGYESVLAMNGKQAFEFISYEKPDLVLLDVMMPDVDGYEVCRILKNDMQLKDIPVIFLTAKIETEDIVRGFEAGGVDYVLKPFNVVELKVRIKTHLELKKSHDELKRFNKELKKANEELHEANEIIGLKNLQLKEVMGKLEFISKTDSLTGLFNRRNMIEKIEEELSRYKRNKKPFSIVIADIDFFKNVNDTYGHDCGDFVLKLVSQNLLSAAREQDSIARWGGEEFLMLLPETGTEGAVKMAERARKSIEENVFNYNKISSSVTMTFGVSVYNGSEGIDSMIKRADNALYEGKRKGRNCVVTA